MFLSNGSLGEREMLWEHEPQAGVSRGVHECFSNSLGTRRTLFSISFRKHCDDKREIAC